MRVVVVVGIVVVVVVLVVEVVVVDATSPLHAEMIRTRIRGRATRRMFSLQNNTASRAVRST
jgi:hypothetical protein